MKFFSLGIAVLAAFVAVGCAEDTGTPPPPPMSEAKVQENIDRINANTTMSPEMKQRAIAGVKSAAEMQRQMAANANKGKPGSK